MTNNTPDYEDNLYFEEKKMTDCKNCPYTDEYCASGDCLAEENKELKDEIRFLFDREEILIKKLNIALMCVRDYAKRSEWGTTELGESCYFGTNGYELAEEALAKIKEVGTINEVKFKPFSKRLLEEKLSENEKLKDLLKECKEHLKYVVICPQNKKIVEKIDQVLRALLK